jgi:N-dimethylarginine dimethylaminohydrolase
MPAPRAVLMCPPDHFQVVDQKNPHMAGQLGRVETALAAGQWNELRAAFASHGMPVETIAPRAGCEDMVFCANQTFAGLDANGRRVCVLSRMKHDSRQREVPAFEAWFARNGYQIAHLPEGIGFEGGGDALWQPNRARVWFGFGHRSDARAAESLAHTFGVTVLRLRLVSERFYHLDTALCLLDAQTALVHPRALEPAGLELVRAVIPRVIEAPDDEAHSGMACNACALPGRRVLIQRGNPVTVARLREHGFHVQEVDTGEYLKSGGSVYCMKAFVW